MKSIEFKMWGNVGNDHLENSYNNGGTKDDPVTLEELSLGLQKLGLSDLEVKLYLTLLTYGTLTAVQAADRSAIPRSRAYDALASLERKGLLASPPVKPTRYGVLSPKESLRGLIDRISEEYSKRVEELSRATDELVGGLQPLFEKRPTGPTDVAWIISGARNIQGELRAMLSKVKKQFFVSYDPELDPFHKLRNFGPVVRRLRARGVRFMSLFDLSAPALKHAEEFGKTFGSEIRFRQKPFGPLGIYALGEGQILVAYQSTPASSTYDLAFNLVRSPLAGMLVEMMRRCWEEGVPLEQARKKLGKVKR